MIIGASYIVSVEVGIATTLAVILHEIPQEIGDFGVLLHSGFTKIQAILVNFASALLAILGVIVVFVLEDMVGLFSAWMIPIAAGGFIYIAGSDLVPELHKTTRLGYSFIQLLAILVGILAMVALLLIE
jgi:zinc and cadmium transporter